MNIFRIGPNTFEITREDTMFGQIIETDLVNTDFLDGSGFKGSVHITYCPGMGIEHAVEMTLWDCDGEFLEHWEGRELENYIPVILSDEQLMPLVAASVADYLHDDVCSKCEFVHGKGRCQEIMAKLECPAGRC